MNNNIKQIRNQRKLTQSYCATRSGLDRSQWGHYESGKNIPNVYTAIKIAQALGVTVEEVFQKPGQKPT